MHSRKLARRITAVIPYYGYASPGPRQAAGADLQSWSRTATTAGADRDCGRLHAPQLQGFFNIPVDQLFDRRCW
jgi:ribose-phosphate pyrophosphokinase